MTSQIINLKKVLADKTPATLQEGIDRVKDIRDIQGESGNWNYSSYMQGLYNGIECVLCILENREPQYRSEPDQWLENIENTDELPEAVTARLLANREIFKK